MTTVCKKESYVDWLLRPEGQLKSRSLGVRMLLEYCRARRGATNDEINQDQECSAPNVSDHSKETDATNLQSDEAVELCAGMTVVISSRFKRLNGQKAVVLSLLKEKVKVQMDNQEVKKFARTALTVCDPEKQGGPQKRQRT